MNKFDKISPSIFTNFRMNNALDKMQIIYMAELCYLAKEILTYQ